MTTAREIHLASRPQGWPTPENFRTVETELADPGPGEVLVRNTFMSVDPYMRGRMNDVKSYVPPFALDAALDGGAVGEVIASGSDDVAVGDTVLHQAGWRTHALLPAAAARTIDVSQVPASAYLGALGMPGMTAYVGLTRIAELKEGDTVFISGAAGAVGSVAGQIARQLGAAKVIGSAGSPEKVAWLKELGFDVALNYKDEPIRRQLRGARTGRRVLRQRRRRPPRGGDRRDGRLRPDRRVRRDLRLQRRDPSPGPRNLMMLVSKRLTLRGFIVSDHRDAAGEFYQRAGGWVADGSLTWRETVVDGLDNAVDAFLGLHRGDNTGKMLVRL